MTKEQTQPTVERLQLPMNPVADAPDAYSAFGLSNYYGEVLTMLRLRFHDETWRALPYYGLASMSYDPALGIELVFSSTTVRLRGRNLFLLFTMIGDQSVRWVWEADRANSLQMAESLAVIDRIEIGAGNAR
jgi:hypothetical protein